MTPLDHNTLKVIDALDPASPIATTMLDYARACRSYCLKQYAIEPGEIMSTHTMLRELMERVSPRDCIDHAAERLGLLTMMELDGMSTPDISPAEWETFNAVPPRLGIVDGVFREMEEHEVTDYVKTKERIIARLRMYGDVEENVIVPMPDNPQE